MFVKYYLLAAT